MITAKFSGYTWLTPTITIRDDSYSIVESWNMINIWWWFYKYEFTWISGSLYIVEIDWWATITSDIQRYLSFSQVEQASSDNAQLVEDIANRINTDHWIWEYNKVWWSGGNLWWISSALQASISNAKTSIIEELGNIKENQNKSFKTIDTKVNEILEKEIEIEPTDLSWIEKIKEVSKKQDAKLDKIEKWLTSFIKEQKQEKDEIVWLSKILTKIELEQETERKLREEEERKEEEMKQQEKEKREREEEEMLSSLLEEEFRIFEENQKQEKIKELEAEKEEIEKELNSLTK